MSEMEFELFSGSLEDIVAVWLFKGQPRGAWRSQENHNRVTVVLTEAQWEQVAWRIERESSRELDLLKRGIYYIRSDRKKLRKRGCRRFCRLRFWKRRRE